MVVRIRIWIRQKRLASDWIRNRFRNTATIANQQQPGPRTFRQFLWLANTKIIGCSCWLLLAIEMGRKYFRKKFWNLSRNSLFLNCIFMAFSKFLRYNFGKNKQENMFCWSSILTFIIFSVELPFFWARKDLLTGLLSPCKDLSLSLSSFFCYHY